MIGYLYAILISTIKRSNLGLHAVLYISFAQLSYCYLYKKR